MRVDRTTRPVWTSAENEQLHALYLTADHAEIGVLLGRTEAAVKNQCYRLRLTKRPHFTDVERQAIADCYRAAAGKAVPLRELAQQLGHPVASVAKVAGTMGLTDKCRPNSEAHGKALRDGRRAWATVHEHPRGALGMRFSDAALAKISEASKRSWERMTPLDRELRTVKRNKTMIEQYGTGNPSMQGENAYSRCKRGRREDLNNVFFRSGWEANYARYLNFLKEQGEIAEWEYEPLTFVFHGEIRGVISYLPDFRVTANDGTQVYHEVKGWMTSKDRTKLARMKKHYPAVVVRLVDEATYKALAKQCAGLIPHWEGA